MVVAPGNHDAARTLEGLAGRLLGDAAERVRWTVNDVADGSASDHPDAAPALGYRVTAAGGQLSIVATDVRSAACALHAYLAEIAGRRVCWDTPRPIGVERFPDAELAGVPPGPVYHLNFCTHSYTSAFWTWERWEREIDWMALHGVSMPLAMVGHEAVLADVYAELGLDQTAIRTFLGDPAYLAWQFMGCLDGWGAPMPTDWIVRRRALGRRIVDRMRDLGMTPVFPAFVGHVPATLARGDTTTRDWWGFTTHLLDPDDPRFADLARRVVETQQRTFGQGPDVTAGTSHLYAADPFIEMSPPDDEPDYLQRLAASLVDGLRSADPTAVWVMQAWTFDYLDWWTDDRIATFLDAIPDDAMLLLDLWGEQAPQWRRFGGFRGKRWIWCALHDFGGRCDLFGALERTRAELADARRAPSPPIGFGLAMEATDQNHVMYEWLLDHAARRADAPTDWIGRYARQRYGIDDDRLAEAWLELLATVYAAPALRLEPTERPGSVTSRPDVGELLDVDHVRRVVDGWCWYEPVRLVEACRLLVDVARDHPACREHELGHDVVAALATVGVRTADRLLVHVVDAWTSGTIDELVVAADRFLGLLDELDDLLGTRSELRLDTWEQSAAAWASDPHERVGLLEGARRLLSTWTASDAAPLTDYAARLWHGLVGGLYRPRWSAWTDLLVDARRRGHAPDRAELDRRIDAVSEAFVRDREPTPARPTDQLVHRAEAFLARCAPLLSGPPTVRDPAQTPTPSEEHVRE